MSNGSTWCEGQQWRTVRRGKFAYVWAENQLVRYVEAPPLAETEGILEYLKGESGCSKLTCDGKLVTGTWRTLEAYFAETKDRAGTVKVQLYHVCVPAANAAADTAYVGENNCTYKVTMTPYYRLASLPVPTTGTSGITYRIVAEQRDRESGLWTCMIEKREQLTTTTGVVTVADDVFKTVTEQSFYGVRTGNLNHLGAAVALWDVTGNAAGTLVENVRVGKNENCTTDVTQRKTVAKAVTGAAQDTRETVYVRDASRTDENQAAAVIEGVTAAGGVITGRQAVENADGTFRNKEEVRTEIEQLEAQKILADNQAETVTETEDRHVTEAGALPAEHVAGELVDVVNVVSEGKLFIRKIKRAVAKLWSGKVVRSTQDLFEETTETHSDAVSAALAAAPAASAGTWYERLTQGRLDWLFNTQETVHQEKTVADAVKTSGGTIYETVEETESVGATALGTAAGAAAGALTTNTDAKTRGGLFRKRQQVRQENAVSEAEKTVRIGKFFTRTTVTNRNQTAAMADPTDKGKAVTNRKTDGGRVDQTEDSVVPVAVTDAWKMGTGDFFSTMTRKLDRNQEAKDTAGTTLAGSGTADAVIKMIRNDVTDEDKVDVEREEQKPTAPWIGYIDHNTADGQIIRTYRFINKTLADVQAVVTALGNIVVGVDTNWNPNKFGLIDGGITLLLVDGTRWQTAYTGWTEAFTEYDRLPSGEILKITGIHEFGFNVSDGASEYNSGTRFKGSTFRMVGNNWYEYVKITGIVPE